MGLTPGFPTMLILGVLLASYCLIQKSVHHTLGSLTSYANRFLVCPGGPEYEAVSARARIHETMMLCDLRASSW